MDLTQKAAYIKGLMEGMEFDTTTKEGKLIAALLDVVEDLSEAVCDLADDVDDLQDKVDAIDEDLSDVEDYLFEEDGDDAEGCSCCTPEDGDVYQITCPNCNKVVCVNEQMLNDEDLCCPRCGVKWEPDFEDDFDTEDLEALDGETDTEE